MLEKFVIGIKEPGEKHQEIKLNRRGNEQAQEPIGEDQIELEINQENENEKCKNTEKDQSFIVCFLFPFYSRISGH